MSDSSRLRIVELAETYRLEPTVRDLFVEGARDRAFFEWYLASSKTRARPVDVVDVPAQVVQRHGQENSNRGRVVALALEMANRWPDITRQLGFVVDADLAQLLGLDVPQLDCLRLTDFSSLELYAYCESTFEKFFMVALQSNSGSGRRALAHLTPVLRDLYALRAANVSLGWGMNWISPIRLIQFRSNGVQFELDEYRRRYLQSNGRWEQRSTFEGEESRIRVAAVSDIRAAIRGHDFAEVFHQYCREVVGSRYPFKSKEAAACALLLTVERADLDGHPLFTWLALRFKSA